MVNSYCRWLASAGLFCEVRGPGRLGNNVGLVAMQLTVLCRIMCLELEARTDVLSPG